MYLKFRITFKFNLISLTLMVIFTYCALRLDAIISVFSYNTIKRNSTHLKKKNSFPCTNRLEVILQESKASAENCLR